MNRILILGPSGMGKTTLSRRLGERLRLPTLHLDTVYWIRDWQHLSKEDFHQWMAKYLANHRQWVIDGNYTNNRHFELRLKMADTIILLDYGSQAALKGIHERASTYKHQVRSDMAEGCVEGIDQAFLQYVAMYYKTRMKWLKATVMQHRGHKRVLVFRSREETNRWLSTL